MPGFGGQHEAKQAGEHRQEGVRKRGQKTCRSKQSIQSQTGYNTPSHDWPWEHSSPSLDSTVLDATSELVNDLVGHGAQKWHKAQGGSNRVEILNCAVLGNDGKRCLQRRRVDKKALVTSTNHLKPFMYTTPCL